MINILYPFIGTLFANRKMRELGFRANKYVYDKLSRRGPTYIKALANSSVGKGINFLANEYIASGGGSVPIANGVIRTINLVKNTPKTMVGLAGGALGALTGGSFSEGYDKANDIVSKIVKSSPYVGFPYNPATGLSLSYRLPDIKKQDYSDDINPNTQKLSDGGKRIRAGMRGAAEGAVEAAVVTAATGGLGNAIKVPSALANSTKAIAAAGKLSNVKKVSNAMRTAGMAASAGYIDYRDAIDTYNDESLKGQNDKSTPDSRDKWYYSPYVGYGVGALGGSLYGNALANLLGMQGVGRSASTIGGGILGAILMRKLQQKLMSE